MADLAFGAFNIVAGVFGSLGLASFAASFVPKPLLAVTQVTVMIGQTATSVGKDPDSMMGDIPVVSVFSVDGRLIGSSKGSDWKMWAAGSVNQVPLKNHKGVENVQSEYIAIYAVGPDAICISALGLKNPKSDDSFGWSGDTGQTCGMQFHWSETMMGSTSNTKDYRPNCVWITGQNSVNSIRTQGFSMHIIDFSKTTPQMTLEYEKDHRLMCGSPACFSAWTRIDPVIWPPFFIPALQYSNKDGTDTDPAAVLVPGVDLTNYDNAWDLDRNKIVPKRLDFPQQDTGPSKRRERAAEKRSDSFNGILISSMHPEHSARELCEAANSYGPDVVSEQEGLFCDMEQKLLWPLCSQTVQDGCFDMETDTLRGGHPSIPKREYQYHTVKRWLSTKKA